MCRQGCFELFFMVSSFNLHETVQLTFNRKIIGTYSESLACRYEFFHIGKPNNILTPQRQLASNIK
jgi:hypothetical protein